jgi:hypothetical protein
MIRDGSTNSMNRKSKAARARRRIATMLGSGAIALALGVMMTANVAAAAECDVPSGTYPSIQSAVNDSSCNPIVVADGSYTENVVINRSLTLDGAFAGTDARTRLGSGESVVEGGGAAAIIINAPDVVVDGFKITSTGGGSGYGIDVETGAAGAVIANNIFDGIKGSAGTAQAIDLVGGPDGVVIVHNVIENISSPNSAKGVFSGDSRATDASTGIVVDGNLIKDIHSENKGAYGVTINNGNGSTANYGLVIENNDINTLHSDNGWVHAVGIEADAPDVIVSGNSFSNLTASGPDLVAVWFENEDPAYASSKVNGNNFNFPKGTGVYGIAVDTNPPDSKGFDVGGAPLNGTCNFWGSSNGPGNAGGSGALVSPLVTFNPWSKNPTPQGPCVPKQ